MSKKLKQNAPNEVTNTEIDTKKTSKHEKAVLKATPDQDKVVADNPAMKDKPKKIKMIRDSFTMPESDYAKLAELKKKCLESGIHVKKSELLRAGLLRLSKLNKSALLQVIAQVEILKTGRPAKK